MISYDARPLIKITPPQSAKDRRVKTYTFVEAAKRLPCNWPENDVVPILRRINPDLLGQVRSIFIVLSDDQFRKVLNTLKKPHVNPPPTKEAEADDDEVSMTSEVSEPTTKPESSKSRGSTLKRGAASTAGGPSAKK